MQSTYSFSPFLNGQAYDLQMVQIHALTRTSITAYSYNPKSQKSGMRICIGSSYLASSYDE